MSCSHKGCDQPAAWRVRARVWAVGQPKVPGAALILSTDLVACEQHKQTPSCPVAGLFSEALRNDVQRQLRAIGRAPADFASAEWDFEQLSHRRHLQ